MMNNIHALAERELDQVVGGEAAPAGNEAALQIASAGDTGGSPDYGASRREHNFFHPSSSRRF